MDALMKMYNALIADKYIREQTLVPGYGSSEHRIKFYEYPENGNIDGPIIIIDPLGPPLDAEYGDDDPIIEEYLYQIDVWTKKRLVTKELAQRVKDVLRREGFYYYSGGIDEYDNGIYRDARRVRGKFYTKTLN